LHKGEKLSKVAEYPSSLEAHSVRILLEANGISAIVVGDAISETGLEPVLVFVHQENLDLAQTVIREVPAAAEILIPEWRCVCGETVDAGFNVCWSCGRDHPHNSDDEN
jgi:hypothetical protein